MNKRKLTAIILSISMIFAVSINSTNIVQAKTTEEAQQEIDNNKNKIDDLKDKQNDINAEKSKSQSKLDEIQKEVADKNQKLLTSQKKVDEYKGNIDSLKDNIDKLQGQINDIQSNIDKKKKEEQEKEEILSGRIRSAYKSNLSNQFLYIMLESKNVGDFISNVSSIKYVVDTDNKLIDDIKKVQGELKGEESQLNELNSLEEEKQAEINSLSEKERTVLNEINSYEEDNANLKDYINNLINEKKSVKLNSNNSKSSTSNTNNTNNASTQESSSSSNSESSETKANSSSGFMRPAPGGVTDPFGPRVHPVTGKRSVHTGADLGASYGTPILASKSGTVVEAGWNTAYGNMVIIDHGDGTSTLYGHSSRLAVQAGQHVSQGQVIAYVGSTGYSTGPHLHFGIMINGEWVNPMNYIS